MKFVSKLLVETADASRGKSTASSFLKNLALVAAFFLVAYLLLGLLASFLALAIPDSWERKIGTTVSSEDLGDERLTRPREILARLLEQDGLRDLNYQLFVIDFSGPNAMAFPGGGIGVTPELLDLVKSEKGLALVLAHEIGHHQHRHILQRLGRGLTFGLFAALFGFETAGPIDGALRAADTRFSRQQEYEADEAALLLVHRVYGDTEGGLEFFERLQEMDPGQEWLQYFSTHPLTRDRISRMQDQARALSSNPPR